MHLQSQINSCSTFTIIIKTINDVLEPCMEIKFLGSLWTGVRVKRSDTITWKMTLNVDNLNNQGSFTLYG